MQRNLHKKTLFFVLLDFCLCNLLETSEVADTLPRGRDCHLPLVACKYLGIEGVEIYVRGGGERVKGSKKCRRSAAVVGEAGVSGRLAVVT